MGWIEDKSVWFFLPGFTDEFVVREGFEGLESAGEAIGPQKVVEVRFELVVGVIEVALHRGILDGSVHALDLPVGSGMVGFGEPVVDAMKVAEPVERMAAESCGWPVAVLGQIGELDAVVSEHGVDAVRNRFNERFEEGGSGPHVCFFGELYHSELRGSVDGHQQVELAFGRSHLGQVDVEEADRIGSEPFPASLVALDLGQAADAVTFQTTMKRRAGELRDRGPQGIQAVVERQQCVPAKRDDDSFLFHRQNGRPGIGGTRPAIGSGLALPPLGDRLRVNAVTPRQRPQPLLTMLYRSTDRLCRSGAPL